ncbi:MAG: NfeD family protein [Pseudomonadota bacterium]|nr:NfeD family protein [Pseudomonadota bacterium]
MNSVDLSTWLLIAGLALLAVEIILLGMGTFVLLFLGLGLLLSGVLMLLGLIPETMAAAIWSVSLASVFVTLVLWKPLRRMQTTEVAPPSGNSGDFANDLEFELDADIDKDGGTQVRYSGIDWTLRSVQPLIQGTRVRVVRKEVGAFWVEPISDKQA